MATDADLMRQLICIDVALVADSLLHIVVNASFLAMGNRQRNVQLGRLRANHRLMSQRKVVMGEAAKAYLAERHTRQHGQKQQSIAVEPWSLWISGKKIVRDLKSTIY